MLPTRCFILGSGASVRMGLWQTQISQLPLWQWLMGEMVIGCNFSELYFASTVLICQDYKLVATQEWIDEVPLVVACPNGYYQSNRCRKLGNNIILVKDLNWQLSGMAALSLTIKLGVPEVYLLGQDACSIDGHTHFYDDTDIGTYYYQGEKSCGIGKDENGNYRTGNYNKIDELNNHFYKPFEQALKDGIKIYNVSPESKITTFPQMNYAQLFSYLEFCPEIVDQEEIRNEIRKIL